MSAAQRGICATAILLAILIGCSGSVPRDPDFRTATALAQTPSPTEIPLVPTAVPTPLPVDTPAPPSPTPATESATPTATIPASPTPTQSPDATPTATVVSTAVPIINPEENPVTTFGLFLEVVGLGEENIVRGNTLFLSGKVSADAVLSVNGVIIPIDSEGVFGVNISLNPGPNELEVVASDLSGNTESRVITVISLDESQ